MRRSFGDHSGAFNAPATERIDVWIATLAELRANAVEFGSWLDPSVDRMQRFRFDEDRERFLLGHGYLRWIMGQYLDYPPQSHSLQTWHL
ncbi:MAG: hypothetical protein R2818_15370 [Flavobacteriales bacterium]